MPFPPSNTEILQGQAGDIPRSWQETIITSARMDWAVGPVRKMSAGEEGSCLLMHPCSCSRAQLSITAPSKARLEHRMGLTSPNSFHPLPLLQPPLSPSICQGDGEATHRGVQHCSRLTWAAGDHSIWQRFHCSQLTTSNNSGINRARLAGCRNIIHLVSYCETFNYWGNMESCNDYKNKYLKCVEIN